MTAFEVVQILFMFGSFTISLINLSITFSKMMTKTILL
ncbi:MULTISPECIES: putative holin-like toxin [Streptococcus]